SVVHNSPVAIRSEDDDRHDGGKPTRRAYHRAPTRRRPRDQQPRSRASTRPPRRTQRRAPPPPASERATRRAETRAKENGADEDAERKAQHGALPEFCSHDDCVARDQGGSRAEYVRWVARSGRAWLRCPVGSDRSFLFAGEIVRAKIYRNARCIRSVTSRRCSSRPRVERRHSRAVPITSPSAGGCQYQMLSRTRISPASSSQPCRPSERPMPSPEQYNYRTKLTPHFEAPNSKRGKKQDNRPKRYRTAGLVQDRIQRERIAEVIDIEGRRTAQLQLRSSVKHCLRNSSPTKRVFPLILRDSLPLSHDKDADPETHICVTDHKGTASSRSPFPPTLSEWRHRTLHGVDPRRDAKRATQLAPVVKISFRAGTPATSFRGTDESFIKQMLMLRPRTVCT
ncbi:unnamed protein product, partial [Mycena citricolor]